jgi:cytidyltransferase-like protein
MAEFTGKYSLLIGRWQPLHDGHIKMIRQVLKDGKKVVVGIRNTPIDTKNPYTVEQRQEMFKKVFGDEVETITLPDIGEVVYGRDVGWGIRQIELDPYTEGISATNVRKAKVWWLTGNSGCGKTTISMMMKDVIHLDGDRMRQCWKLGFTKEDRYENNIRIANIAQVLKEQGYDVVISTICPYKELRQKCQDICGCKFVYIVGGKEPSEEFPYEK